MQKRSSDGFRFEGTDAEGRISIRVGGDIARRLRTLADELERSQQSLGMEALELLFLSYGVQAAALPRAGSRRRN